MPAAPAAITLLLNQVDDGDQTAVNRLVALLYDQLRGRARWRLRGERAGHSLAPTDLANEALLRILRGAEIKRARNSKQLFRAYARAMRQVLVDHARRRQAGKRGGHWTRNELDDLAEDVCRRSGGDLEPLDELLGVLAVELPREASVLELRFFGGFALSEIAAILQVSLSTVERDSRFALAWLRARLAQEAAHAR